MRIKWLVLPVMLLLASLAQAQNYTASLTASDAGSCNTANACLSVAIGSSGSATLTLAGTFSGTFQFEGLTGGTWGSISVTPLAGGTAVTSATAVGQWQVNVAAVQGIRIRCSTYASGTATSSIFISSISARTGGSGGGAPSGPAGGALCSGSTYPNPLDCAVLASYTFQVVGGTVTATPNFVGGTTYSNADTAVVVNDVLTALATTGGRLYFKTGVYPVNSMTAETATGCSNFGSSGNLLAYAFGFPSNTPFATSVQWIVEGEATSVWQGEVGSTTINSSGVVFNITSTAVSSVAANSVLAGWWARPVTNCTLVASNVSNDVHFLNVTTRFPTNTRGNEIAYASWFLDDAQYDNVVADFNLAYNSIATGSAPTVGSYNSIGLTSTVSNSGNWQDFRNTFSTGYNLGYDFQSEHVTGTTITAIYSNYACEFGRTTTPAHPIIIQHFLDQENLHGCFFGPAMGWRSSVDLQRLSIEVGASGWYARTNGAMTESNPGYTTGFITYDMTEQGVNSNVIANAPLFTSGGQNFQLYNATSAPNQQKAPASVNFALLPNASTWGPEWVNNGSNLTTCAIASGLATSSASCIAHYAGQTANADQFAKITVGGVTSSGLVGPYVRGNATAATQTYYEYVGSTSGGLATSRGIFKQVAGTGTLLIQTSANSGVAASDTMELDVIGNTLCAYYNGAPEVFSNNSNCVTDSSIASGYPGQITVVTGNSISSFAGGSLPTKTGTDSIYGQKASWIAPQQFVGGLATALYTVSSGTTYPALPSASSVAPGTALLVTDATSISPGTCVGGSTNWVWAVSDGTSAWHCP